MQFEVRIAQSNTDKEVFCCGTPEPGRDPKAEAMAIFAASKDVADSHGAKLCRQRVFVPQGQLPLYQQARAAALGVSEGDIPCTWLMAGGEGVGGVQSHAIASPGDWTRIAASGGLAGWTLTKGSRRWAMLAGIGSSDPSPGGEATMKAFLAGEALLGQAGMTLHHVARTWFFLGGILDWYGAFNEARTSLFVTRGLLRRGHGADASQVPASTGIGIAPAAGGRLALDIFAVAGDGVTIDRRGAAGRQHSAYDYGSAFARVASAPTPAGRTVFVSGTAAIDPQGRTCAVGDAKEQIRLTLENVRAVLADMGCGDSDVVEAIAYCQSPAIAAEFLAAERKALPWPWVTAIGDVCRADLLFEVEVTACVADKVGLHPATP